MTSGGQQVGGAQVKRTEIFTIDELYEQFKARYEDPKHTGKWKARNERGGWAASTFDAYSYSSKLSDGKWHEVQIVKMNGGTYYLKLYGDGPEPYEPGSFFNGGPYDLSKIKDMQGKLPQLCLLKEAIDNALQAVSLSAKVYTTFNNLGGETIREEVTAARCAKVKKQ